MKTHRMTLGRSPLSELFSVRPPEYYIIVAEGGVSLARVDGRGRTDLLLQSKEYESPELTWEEFSRRLKEFPGYFGQPVRVLIHNSRIITYIRKLETESPVQLYERLTGIPKEKLELRQTILNRPEGRLFVWQGIDRDYLAILEKSLSANQVQVTDIISLGAFLLLEDTLPAKGEPATHVYQLPGGEQMYAVLAAEGGVLIDSLVSDHEADNIQGVFCSLDQTFHGSSTSRHLFYELQTVSSKVAARSTRLFGRLLRPGTRAQNEIKQLSYRPIASRTASTIRTALNSVRLLAAILLAVTVVLTLAAVLIGAWSSRLAQPIDEFQERYNTKLRLTHEMETLKTDLTKLRSDQGSQRQTAVIASAFCQQSFSGLFLTDLTIQYADNGQAEVEAKGAARNEASVFALRDHLGRLFEPYVVTVNSVRPQGRGARGPADSLITFGLAVALHE